jgi:hypothetical protein
LEMEAALGGGGGEDYAHMYAHLQHH